VGRTLYRVSADGSDQFIGAVDSRDLAAEIVAAVNAAADRADVPDPRTGRLPGCLCGLTGPASAPRVVELHAGCRHHGRGVEIREGIDGHADS
jgi:hypothetical protein